MLFVQTDVHESQGGRLAAAHLYWEPVGKALHQLKTSWLSLSWAVLGVLQGHGASLCTHFKGTLFRSQCDIYQST